VNNAEKAYPNVNFRYIITPTAQLPFAGDGHPSSLARSIKLGEEDAKHYVQMYEEHGGPNWEMLRARRGADRIVAD
jgi:hypothetical protein